MVAWLAGSGRRPAGRLAWSAVLVALALQLDAHRLSPPPRPNPEALSRAPSGPLARVFALGDPVALGRVLMLGIQAYDVQPGLSIPFRQLDYERLTGWLALILDLDPRSQYALLCASHLYAEVPDPERSRRMLDFIHTAFLADPDRRWPWLAHAVVLARHRLGDPQLALRFAHDLRTQVRDPSVPHWATQMEVFALADMSQTEAARALLGGLLESGAIVEPHERHFLIERLHALEQERGAPPQR